MLSQSLTQYLLLVILWLLHTTVTIFLNISSLTKTFVAMMTSSNNLLDVDMVRTLPKIPQHIAFLFLEDISFPDLARLLVWTVMADIPVVSLFDPRGELKARQDELLLAVRKEYVRQTAADKIPPLSLSWRPHTNAETVVVTSGGSYMYPDANGNGSSSGGCGKSLTVSLLCPKDGKEDVVKAARDISSDVETGRLNLSDVSEQLVGDRLKTNKSLPDPCLLVRFGSIASNANFLPWQIRLTEMHHLATHKRIASDKLLEVLFKYAKCHQRFGK